MGKSFLAYELAYLLDAVLVDLEHDGGGVTAKWGYRPQDHPRSRLLDALEAGATAPRPLRGFKKPDLIPGHEGYGEVVAIGPGVTALAVGDKVGNAWLWSACGSCEYCRTGWETLCPNQKNGGYFVDGSFGEYMLVDERFAARIPDGVDPVEVAPILCAGVTVYKGLKETEVRPGQWVVISGIGGLGHVAVQYAIAMGMRVAAVDIGARAFLGNSGMAGGGNRVPKDGLVAVLSFAPRKAKAGTSWLGSPPVRLRRQPQDADLARTYAPSTGLRVARALWELLRIVPVFVTCAIGLAVLFSLAGIVEAAGVGWAIVASGPVLMIAGAVAAGVSTVAKWALLGRLRAGEHPLWSSFVWRSEVSDTFTEMVAAPWFAWAAAGTPALVWWLRSLGARIGRGVWIDSYWLPEADLVELGDASTVNRGCVVQTHLFHDRIMSMDEVSIERGGTLGPHSVILPAAAIGADATVGPASLVMRGETVPAGSRWSGNPIGPWREVVVRDYRATR